MIQNAPELVAVEIISFILSVRVFDGKCVVDPQRHIRDRQKCHKFTAGFFLSEFERIGTSSQSVTNEGSLNHYLCELLWKILLN